MNEGRIIAVLCLLLVGLATARADESLTGLIDPTRPYDGSTTSGQAHGGLVLQSTLVSPLRRLAVINGRTFTVGERVGNAMIVSITPYQVVLSRAGKHSSLRLLPYVGIQRRTNANAPDNSIP